MLDKRTIKYADSYLKVASFIKRHRTRKLFSAQLIREFNQFVSAIDVERKRLINNEEVREELMAE